ncbi:dual specificity protein phosphatase family protein [Caulobacter sp. Root1472]|uniref:protein-tyrosine phosphatase family protein n=1 Tax=Caulobacter sp. Root1472 TaxID=1736470 RepID=UPI0006FF1AEC|nr:dual specificity protein phosphatase family protein [Caulobacter sp. Root1472]KQZ30966.1 hypothetical protein ASD47_17530 [Caulobacter sp. Root1472]
MASDIYWIAHDGAPRLAIMARPRAGDWLEDEVSHWRDEGVSVVVSLLELHETNELGLEAEQAACENLGLRFWTFPIPDRGAPTDFDVARKFAEAIAQHNGAVAIHCRAGIGRSSLIAALVLVVLGLHATDAFTRIAETRRLAVPDTDDQRRWVEAFEARLRA